MWQLNNFDIDDFLANYWQQKPLLIRQAFPAFESVISPEELAGLAMEQGVLGRLVIEKDAAEPWQLSYGPFSEETFTSLPQTHYSLLVAECEKWIPELQALVDCFDFIPKWRLDDLMISYAPEHGSVGPHVDDYDVFLLQASGQKRWSIGDEKLENPALIEGLDLAILKQFDPAEEWILEPGDMLYLPPKIAHHGVAVGDGCMTYSIGFKGQSVSDLVDSFMLEAETLGLTETRYSDVPLTRDRNPAEIKVEDILQFKSMIYQMLDQSAPLWPDIVGKLVSDSNLSEDIDTVDCQSIEQAAQYLWQRHPDSKFFYHQSGDDIRFYFNGQVKLLEMSDQHLDFCQLLCNQMLIPLDQYHRSLSSASQGLLLELIACHALIPVLEDD